MSWNQSRWHIVGDCNERCPNMSMTSGISFCELESKSKMIS